MTTTKGQAVQIVCVILTSFFKPQTVLLLAYKATQVPISIKYTSTHIQKDKGSWVGAGNKARG